MKPTRSLLTAVLLGAGLAALLLLTGHDPVSTPGADPVARTPGPDGTAVPIHREATAPSGDGGTRTDADPLPGRDGAAGTSVDGLVVDLTDRPVPGAVV
ncbi:MAG: hypothetical protein ACYTG6_03415, partial [Planctomycetota bacterium]